ncbi:MAG: NAD(+)/NADH kinase [Pseudomonadales bacterium]|nr:NAD(+)/NADH kinase [Pseudomonadales bacterium]
MTSLGIVVNPMSGRDVRRVAARASITSHHDKQQHVTRLVLGALAQGVERIYLGNEPFRINERAIENLPERNQVEILSYPLTHTARDTTTMVKMMWDKGCRTFIVLGGDGTSRIVAAALPDAVILPLSTGTNNVFPVWCEASVAGAAAGMIASQQLDYRTHCFRCKQIHVELPDGSRDIALVDAVLLRNDMLGSYLPFAGKNIAELLLTRAEPASVGMSPIGGYLLPCHERDPFGVAVSCQADSERQLRIPISPGLYDHVGITDIRRVEPGARLTWHGPGLLAFDGDRSHQIDSNQFANVWVEADGPWIINPAQVLESAALSGNLGKP